MNDSKLVDKIVGFIGHFVLLLSVELSVLLVLCLFHKGKIDQAIVAAITALATLLATAVGGLVTLLVSTKSVNLDDLAKLDPNPPEENHDV